MMTRREFVEGASAVVCLAGCRSFGEEGKFSMAVLNPDCMSGGAGLCVVMRTPSGKTYLFDTANGDFKGKKRKNNGRDIIVPWLKAHGIGKIDGLVISHYHADHFGGFLWMWDKFPIARIFNNNYTPDFAGCTADDMREYEVPRKCLDAWGLAHPGGLVENTKAGDDLGWNEPGVEFDVVWPPKGGYVKPLENRQGYAKGDGHFHHLLNGNSTALRIKADGKVFFIMGDIQADYVSAYMRPLMEREGTWGCDVAVLPAHGTRPDVAVREINAMSPRPRAVIASLGNVPWMFGTGRAVERVYRAAGYETFATCLCGDVVCEGEDAQADKAKIHEYVPV